MKKYRLHINQEIHYEKRVACIGFFESLHIAHLKLLNKCFEYPLTKTFLTFDFQKNLTINKTLDTYLISKSQKEQMIEEFGFDEYIELIFDIDAKNTPASLFEQYLHRLGIEILICGFDFRYGKDRLGNVDTLKRSGLFEVIVIDEIKTEHTKISSSLIKKLVENAELEKIKAVLGRNYRIQGKVVEGKKLGRTIGYPTANLEKNKGYHYPKLGVYYGNVIIDKQIYPSMISVGLNPTVEHLEIPVIEAHIFDFDQNIYGKEVEVEFICWVRSEIKFASINELIAQLKADEKLIRSMYETRIV